MKMTRQGLTAFLQTSDTQPLSAKLATLDRRWHGKTLPRTAATDAGGVTHLLNRISYGITDEALAIAQSMGESEYLEYQLDYETLDDSELEATLAATLPTLTLSYAEMFERLAQDRNFSPAGDLIAATIARQVFSPRQLFETMVELWSNHFNVFILDGAVQYLKTGDDRDHIRPNAMGRFRDLLHANARSPAMLLYLDNYSNTKFGPNENYARELLELHTLGVDGGYTEEDVKEVARCFTGWTIDPRSEALFAFNPLDHDIGSKTVLGHTIAAGQGMEDGNQVLDILAAHPATARHVATKLCQRFIADKPPATIVERVANEFTASDGDLRQVLRTLLSSDEFRASQGSKFRRPVEYLVAMLRTLNPIVSGDFFGVMFQELRRLGQVPFFWTLPTGYPDRLDHWLNTNALLRRWNLASAMAYGDVPLALGGVPPGQEAPVMADFFQIRVFELLGDARAPAEIVDRVVARVLRRSLATADRQTLLEFAASGAPVTVPLSLDRAVATARGVLAGLLLSSYFQMR